MSFSQKYDKGLTGIISGFLLPFIVGFIIYIFTSAHAGLYLYLTRIADARIITHSITLCVFPNVIIFLLFNRYDMLKAARGVLAVTIVWAAILFGVKIFL